ncbi:MAG TPA: TetR family transcriptional regulator [Tepidisphaeraceae bacterium]|nr:TetR family transcriptional regulator [Tepidisphaeraceae bacterium]
MTMDSRLSNPSRRTPVQDRSSQRVKLMLQAAAELIAQVGYEKMTMTGIAERAATSVGSLYQYFPDKETIVQALFEQLGEEMEERWTPLFDTIPHLDAVEVARRLVDLLHSSIDEHPAYLPLLDAPLKLHRSAAARSRLRARLAKAFLARQPNLSPDDSLLVANVTVQILKGFGALYARGKSGEKIGLIRETTLALSAYLNARLQAKGI